MEELNKKIRLFLVDNSWMLWAQSYNQELSIALLLCYMAIKSVM